MSISDARIRLYQDPTRTLAFEDVNSVSAPEILAAVEITSKAVGYNPEKSAGGFFITIQFVNKKCENIIINDLVIAGGTFVDFKDHSIEFSDPKDNTAPEGTCGTRSFKLLLA